MQTDKGSLFKDSAVYLTANIINAVIPFALLPILTRYLSPDKYGEVAMFQTLLAFLGALVGLETCSAVSRKYFDEGVTNKELSEYIAVSLQVILVSGTLLLLVILAGGGVLANVFKLNTVFMCYAVITAVATACLQLRLTQWQVRKKAKQFGAFQNLQSLINMIISLILVVGMKMGASGRIMAQVWTAVLFALIAICSLQTDGLLRFISWKPSYMKDALSYGVPLVPHSIGIILLSMIDRVIIADKIGIGEAGIYMVAVQLSMGLYLLFASLNNAYSPWLFMKLTTNNAREKRMIVKYTYVFYVGVLLIALLSFAVGPWAVNLLAGAKYERAGRIIGWLALSQCFLGMQYSVVNFIYYSKRTGLLSLSSLGTGVLNVVLLLALVPRMKIEGAAIAMAVSMGVRFLILWAVAQKSHPMPWLVTLNGGCKC
jgi:O-antigen/teichoic acid export membrane protein